MKTRTEYAVATHRIGEPELPWGKDVRRSQTIEGARRMRDRNEAFGAQRDGGPIWEYRIERQTITESDWEVVE